MGRATSSICGSFGRLRERPAVSDGGLDGDAPGCIRLVFRGADGIGFAHVRGATDNARCTGGTLRAPPVSHFKEITMPIYEYRCNDCGADFERLVRTEGQEVACECGSEEVERQWSVFAAHMAGGGSAKTSSDAPACTTCYPGGSCSLP